MAKLKLLEMDSENEMIYFRKDDKIVAFDADVAVELIADVLDDKRPIVVRCNDCIHYYADPWGYGNCVFEGGVSRRTKESDFCSWGERRDNGENTQN